MSAEIFKGKIGILGAGALGCFYGGRMSRAGHDVRFLMRRDFEAVNARGLKIVSFEGDFEIYPPVYRHVEELGICDLLMIGLKTTDNASLPELLAASAGPDTLVLTMQNGLGNEEEIGRILTNMKFKNPGERILGGTAFLCSHRDLPGTVYHTAHGWVQLAEFRGAARERTHAIAGLFHSAGIRCEVLDSLAEARWRKLVWNITFNGLGVAVPGGDTSAILGDERLAATARGLMQETIAAARADGVEIEAALIDKMMADTAIMDAYKSSMQIDFENRRPLEVEAILGEPLRRAQRGGIAVPRLEMLYGIVRRADALLRAGEV